MENAGVLSPQGRFFEIWLALCLPAVLTLYAQEGPPAQSPTPTSPAKPLQQDFPDNAGGLEHLAKQIMKAQKEGDTARASALAESMVLPDPTTWYLETFGPEIANDEGAKYAADVKNLPAEIQRFFFGAIQNHFAEVSAARFGETCDDNAGETAFGTLQLRLQPAALYELRLQNGNQFLRLFTLVYVDGAFRYALAPRVPDHFPFVPRTIGTSGFETKTATAEPGPKRVRMGGAVVAAQLIKRVQPQYPEKARNERLEGTVRLHAIIGKDGAVSKLLVLKGYCSLAKASMEAVSKWRYRPTLLLGNPVDVDTTIDVIFSLNR